MPKSALPEKLQDVENHFPDDKQFGDKHWWARLYTWYNKKTKTWFAFSYRCTEWWARWRIYPKVLFAIKSKDGYFRIETNTQDGAKDCAYDARYLLNETLWHVDNSNPWVDVISEGYLSRIQYWCRWHFALQYATIEIKGREIPVPIPLVSFHYYPNAADIPEYGKPRPELDGKLWFFYWNHFDADWVYWMLTSGYLGRNWK